MRKRFLFVMPPGYGHLLPVVPLAWAAQAAGHDVLIASSGVSIHAAIRAGLRAVDVAPGLDVAALQAAHKSQFLHAYPPAAASMPTSALFTELSDAMADGVVALALRWSPSAIIFTPEAGAALVAATRAGVPSVFVSVGLDHTPELMAARYATLERTMTRHAVHDLDRPAAVIDFSPPSLRTRPLDGWPMRYIHYGGGAKIDGKPTMPPRPVVAVTFGTIVPFINGLRDLRRIVEAASPIDADFVIAHGYSNSHALEPLPPNVSVTSWLDLTELFGRSAAVIHHGGFGTTLAACAAGLRQMIVPAGADHFHNAGAIANAGAGLAVPLDRVTPDIIQQLITSEPLQAGAARIRREIDDMPPPAAVVPLLAALAS